MFKFLTSLPMENVVSWVVLVFFGGFLIFAIQQFVKRTTELTVLFQELRLAVTELRATIYSQNDKAIERDRLMTHNIEKHDRYIKELWATSNRHETEIRLLEKDLNDQK